VPKGFAISPTGHGSILDFGKRAIVARYQPRDADMAGTDSRRIPQLFSDLWGRLMMQGSFEIAAAVAALAYAAGLEKDDDELRTGRAVASAQVRRGDESGIS
jgi:hypothetical protein